MRPQRDDNGPSVEIMPLPGSLHLSFAEETGEETFCMVIFQNVLNALQ